MPLTTFSFSQQSSSQTLELLSSNYDMSMCIVNCTNRGSCVFDLLNNKYKCACSQHYSGLSCQSDSRACSLNPCLNNGTCVDVNSNTTTNRSSSGFSCECQKEYSGVYCQNKINICANETCSGNGYCEDIDNKPKCKCFNMYEGENCNIQSSQLIAIKAFIKMSSILAIIVIICFYLVILLMDLFKYFIKRSKVKKPKKSKKNKKIKQQFIN